MMFMSIFIFLRKLGDVYHVYCIPGKFLPRFIFTLFALWGEGEFKTGLIESSVKDYVRKMQNGWIQD